MFSFLHCTAGCNKQLQLFQFAGRGQFWSCLESKTGLRRVRCCQKANKSSRHGVSGISPSRKLIRPSKIGIPQFIGHFVLVGAGNNFETHRLIIFGKQAEVDLMSRIRHDNLVALLGFSTDGPEPLLVYELMQNGSLYDQLHGMNQSLLLENLQSSKLGLAAGRIVVTCQPLRSQSRTFSVLPLRIRNYFILNVSVYDLWISSCHSGTFRVSNSGWAAVKLIAISQALWS